MPSIEFYDDDDFGAFSAVFVDLLLWSYGGNGTE